jgi:hypothetical protein
LRQANILMRNDARFERSEGKIHLFCECGRSGCYSVVWLTRAEYDEQTAAGDAIVISGHRLSRHEPAGR